MSWQGNTDQRRTSWLRALAGLLCVALAFRAGAHQQSLSYGDYQVHGSEVDARLRFAAADLTAQLNLAPRGDGKLTQVELDAVAPALSKITFDELEVQSSGAVCSRVALARVALEQEDGIVVSGAFHCPRPITSLEVRLGFLEALPAGHTNLSLITFENQSPVQRVSQAGSDTFLVEVQPQSPGATLLRFLLLGIEHIFTGYDHIAFLIGLLLLGGSLRSLIGIVSAFTVAHSITLALAALEIFAPPPRLIEPLIALSIVFVACENLWVLRSAAPPVRAESALRHRWMITFAFGLVHGFGFASALRELHLPRTGLALSLVTFNLGVEVGQVTIVALAWPALLALRKNPKRQKQVAITLSAVIGILGLFWFIQRVLI